MKTNCPCCGANLNITIETASALSDLGEKSRPAKSQYAPVRPSVTVVPPQQLKGRGDAGKFRQAVVNAGYSLPAVGSIFNDKNIDSRRLKLWFGLRGKGDIAVLDAELNAAFGDRLIEHGPYFSDSFRGTCESYIVRLKL